LLQGRTTEALVHYETALRLEPSAKAHKNLGLALLYVRQLPEAVAHLEQAVRIEPDFATAHEFLGDALAAQGRQAEAVAHFQRALQIEPGSEHARRALEMLSAGVR